MEVEMTHPFDDYMYNPFGDTSSDSSSSPLGDPVSLFPQVLQDEDGFAAPQEDGMSIFNDSLPDSTSISPGSGSPASQDSIQSMSSPNSSSDGSTDFSFISQEPLSEQTGFDGSYQNLITNASVQVPDRKKRRRNVDPKQQQQQQQKVVGKKRKGRGDESVVMDLNHLSGLSSEELDSLVAALSAEGSLKAEDEKLVRKAKRKIKNRESAQISRIRHREHLQLVEAKLKHKDMVIDRLYQYVNKMKQVMEENGVEPPPEPEIPPFVPPVPSELTVPEPARTVVRPLRIAGLCLMMLFLSFGIVFNVMHHGNSRSDNKNSLVPVSSPSSEPSARVMVETSAPLTKITPAPQANSEPAQPPDSLDVIRRSAYLSYDTEKPDSSLALVIPAENKHVPEVATANAVVERTPSSVMTYTTKAIFGNGKPRLVNTWPLGNTSYMFVNSVSEFVPPTVDQDRIPARTEPVIGLLIPASYFNIPNLARDDVVELVCSVRNATLVPHSVVSRALLSSVVN